MAASHVEPWAMSAIGPKRTSLVAPHMFAFGGNADMTLVTSDLNGDFDGQTNAFAAPWSNGKTAERVW
jgi:hypothetical protein